MSITDDFMGMTESEKDDYANQERVANRKYNVPLGKGARRV